MRLLESNPEITQRELAAELGVSLGGLNYCINALIKKGFIKVSSFRQSKKKLGYVYLLTPAGVGEKVKLTTVFLHRKMQEYEALKCEIEVLAKESANIAPPFVGFSNSSD